MQLKVVNENCVLTAHVLMSLGGAYPHTVDEE